MQIHVVQPGQTLYGIGQAYSVPADELVRANEIPNPNQLVVGQTIVIPIVGMFYWVQPGDNLYEIGQRFGVDYRELARINRIPLNAAVPIGLRLYIPPTPKPTKEFNAYVEPFGQTVSTALQQASRNAVPYLTYLAPFSFRVNRDGTLISPPLDNFKSIADSGNAILMMVVSNLEEGQFSDELGSVILNNQDIQDRLLNNIVRIARNAGFKDIHFDLEFLRPADREAYNQFLRKATTLLHENGFLISTALAPKTSATQQGLWYEAHDYAAHGNIVDFTVIMTYEWGYSGGPPMPVSPIGPVRNVLQYALSEMPANKIMMGQNLYGYDWTLPYVAGGQYARALSPQAAIQLAYQQGVPIQYDVTAQAPHFDYTDAQGNAHKVWFEDARSIQAKFNLVKELGIRGVSYWKLGLSFPQNWLLIQDNFSVRKRA